MDKLLQILRLCLPWLTPKDTCMLKSTCKCFKLRDMINSASWHDHSVDFELTESDSALRWLLRNIGSMQKLTLSISLCVPRQKLQDVLGSAR